MTKVKTTKRLLARVILRSGEKILFAYNKKDAFYFLPGGHVDPNESVSDALMRELVEETNLKPTEISATAIRMSLSSFCASALGLRHRLTKRAFQVVKSILAFIF